MFVESAVPFASIPIPYMFGLQVSNDATTPNSILDVAVGQCRDSTDTYQIVTSSVLKANTAVVGIGGLDTGTVAASTMYSVYVIADPVSGNAPAILLSTNMTTPLLPFGYSIFKKIANWPTDSSSHLLPGYIYGPYNTRLFMYDAAQATTVSTGAATSWTGIALTALVPAVANLPVILSVNALPSAAGRAVSFQPYGGTGASGAAITGQVSSVHITADKTVMCGLNSGVPTINYEWSAGGGDSVAVSIAGYWFNV